MGCAKAIYWKWTKTWRWVSLAADPLCKYYTFQADGKAISLIQAGILSNIGNIFTSIFQSKGQFSDSLADLLSYS